MTAELLDSPPPTPPPPRPSRALVRRFRTVARDLIQAPGDHTPLFLRRRVWALLGSLAFAVAPYVYLALADRGTAGSVPPAPVTVEQNR